MEIVLDGVSSWAVMHFCARSASDVLFQCRCPVSASTHIATPWQNQDIAFRNIMTVARYGHDGVDSGVSRKRGQLGRFQIDPRIIIVQVLKDHVGLICRLETSKHCPERIQICKLRCVLPLITQWRYNLQR